MKVELYEKKKQKLSRVRISKNDISDFRSYMTELHPELKSGRQKPRDIDEKEILAKWANGDPNELSKI